MKIKQLFKENMEPFLNDNGFSLEKWENGCMIYQKKEKPNQIIYFVSASNGRGISVVSFRFV